MTLCGGIFVLTAVVGQATSVSNITTFWQSDLIASPRDSGWGWGSSGSHSFFDIALTALAFMSFGIFLLNLLMNALFFTAWQGLTSTGPIITNIDTGTMGGDDGMMDGMDGNGTTGEAEAAALIYIRRKRAVLELSVDRATATNALAANVLKAIDAMIVKHECLPKMICEGNHQAKIIGHGFQYTMPFTSLSSSYLGEKLGLHHSLPEHIAAILFGITESNCKSHFPECSH